jgi:hypothetical protein
VDLNTKSYVGGASTIVSGVGNRITGSENSFIGSGFYNEINPTNANYNSQNFIGTGVQNLIDGIYPYYGTILNGRGNNILGNDRHSTIINGRNNYLKWGRYNIILGGGSSTASNRNEIIGGFTSYNTARNSILSQGTTNKILGDNTTPSTNSSIINGSSNTITGSTFSTIIGGQNNYISGLTNVHIIGSNITAVESDTTYVESLGVDSMLTGTTNELVGILSNGKLVKNPELTIADDDSDAALSGVTKGQFYQTSGNGASPLNVAGIVMVKQ